MIDSSGEHARVTYEPCHAVLRSLNRRNTTSYISKELKSCRSPCVDQTHVKTGNSKIGRALTPNASFKNGISLCLYSLSLFSVSPSSELIDSRLVLNFPKFSYDRLCRDGEERAPKLQQNIVHTQMFRTLISVHRSDWELSVGKRFCRVIPGLRISPMTRSS